MPANTATCAVRGTLELVMAGLLSFLPDDVDDLRDGLVDLPFLVHHHVVVLRRGGHLDLGVPEADRDLLRRLGAAPVEPRAQDLDRGRHHEYRQYLGEL